MSTFGFSTKRCAICGNEEKVMELASTNAFGSPDLDLRPPEMKRSTMHLWVQQCSHCGYAASDIANSTGVTEERLKTYVLPTCDQINFKSALAKRFYCAYLVSFETEDNTAFDYALYAAWACDDAKDTINATFCRKAAIAQLDKVDDKSKMNSEQKATLLLLKSDLIRRCGCFDAVIQLLKDISFSDETKEKIRLFQLKKAEDKDDECYTVADATSFENL